MPRTLFGLLVALAAVGLTASARAEPARAGLMLSRVRVETPADARAPIPIHYSLALADQPRTAIDHQFAPDGVKGSVGYLCGISGLPKGAASGGPASAFENMGTYLGAKLGLSFR
jgi:hypothetical protein